MSKNQNCPTTSGTSLSY